MYVFPPFSSSTKHLYNTLNTVMGSSLLLKGFQLTVFSKKLLLVQFPVLLDLLQSGASQYSNLTLIMMTSFGKFGFNSSDLIPATDMALEDINENSHILPGYNLVYNTLRDTQASQIALPEINWTPS